MPNDRGYAHLRFEGFHFSQTDKVNAGVKPPNCTSASLCP